MQNKNSKLITRFLTTTILLSFLFSCSQGQKVAKTITPAASQPDKYLPLLKGKRVGVVVNQTSLVDDSTHLVDFLLSKEISVTKVFGPEHGFRGDASDGAHISDDKDPKTGLPILSLYGKNRKPSPDHLSELDVVVFDIQDVGARFYTYISTMHYVMEACAENNLPVIIFDRPNPNGHYVGGPVMEEEFKSFVGMHSIPIVHGLTVGELAKMINGESWLKDKIKCELTVIPVENYDHTMRYPLPVSPSPNLPNDKAINLYPSICLFEGTKMSLGRGTDLPFQVLGYPNKIFGEFTFTPVSIPGVSKYPPLENKECFGVDLRNEDDLTEFSLAHLIEFYQKWKSEESFFTDYFKKLAGTATLQQQIEEGKSEYEIKKSWQGKLIAYKELRKKYLLYKDFE